MSEILEARDDAAEAEYYDGLDASDYDVDEGAFALHEHDMGTETVPVPENIDQADWLVRKLARLRRMMADHDALAVRRSAQIAEWHGEVNGRLEREARFFEEALASYHRALLDDDPKRKSVSLPAGTLKARKHPDTWTVDAGPFLEWAREHAPELVRVKEEPNKADLKKWAIVAVDDDPLVTDYRAIARDSAEPIPGVTVTPGDIGFTVDCNLTADAL